MNIAGHQQQNGLQRNGQGLEQCHHGKNTNEKGPKGNITIKSKTAMNGINQAPRSAARPPARSLGARQLDPLAQVGGAHLGSLSSSWPGPVMVIRPDSIT